MNLPSTRKRLRFVGAVALALGLMASPSEACLFPWCWGWGWGGQCCQSGFGSSGYAVSYAPSYNFAPSYQYAPSCGSCGTDCGSCGSCDSCGTSGYSLSGAWSGTCPSGDCGISSSGGQVLPTPYSGEPVSPPSSPTPSSATPPQTYREEAPDDGFRPPQPVPGTDLLLPADSAFDGGSSSGIAPAGGTTPDSQIERSDSNPFQGESYKIPARDQTDENADGDADNTDDESAGDESRVIEPLHIDSVVATGTTLQRQRSHYRAIFRTPSVARTHVPSQSRWEAIPDVPSLAKANK